MHLPYQMQHRTQLMNISRGRFETVTDYTNRFRRLTRFAGLVAQDPELLIHLYVAGLGPEYTSMRIQDQNLDFMYVETVSIE